MEARGYDPNAPRTHYRQLVWHKNDAWAGLALLIVTAWSSLYSNIFLN